MIPTSSLSANSNSTHAENLSTLALAAAGLWMLFDTNRGVPMHPLRLLGDTSLVILALIVFWRLQPNNSNNNETNHAFKIRRLEVEPKNQHRFFHTNKRHRNKTIPSHEINNRRHAL